MVAGDLAGERLRCEAPHETRPALAIVSRRRYHSTTSHNPLLLDGEVKRSNGAAIASMITGIVAAVILVVLTTASNVGAPHGIGAIIFLPAVVIGVLLGHLGLINARNSGVGRGSAIAGLTIGYVILALVAINLFT